MTPAKACTAVYINQARDAHNPGGPANTIMVKNLDEHKDKIHELFSEGLIKLDEIRVLTSWSLGNHIFGGKDYIQFTFYCYYTIRASDQVNIDELVAKAITKLPELNLGLTHHITHYSDELSGEGLLGPCKRCQGSGNLTSYSSYRADVEYDCPDCGGHGKKLNVETDEQQTSISMA
jgi:hypothetical protein